MMARSDAPAGVETRQHIATTCTPTHPHVGVLTSEDDALRREAAELLSLAEHGWTLDRPMRDALVERLTRLCDRLREHFLQEEDGDYLHDVVVQRPGLQTRVAHLQRQHGTFLNEGDSLTRALLGERAPRDWPARVVRFLEGLRRHEIAEYDLLQEAFLDDLGSGD